MPDSQNTPPVDLPGAPYQRHRRNKSNTVLKYMLDRHTLPTLKASEEEQQQQHWTLALFKAQSRAMCLFGYTGKTNNNLEI